MMRRETPVTANISRITPAMRHYKLSAYVDQTLQHIFKAVKNVEHCTIYIFMRPTEVNASDTVRPSPETNPYVRYAESPTPDASPKGKLPYIPTTRDPTAADSAVEIATSVGATPNFESNWGLIRRM